MNTVALICDISWRWN